MPAFVSLRSVVFLSQPPEQRVSDSLLLRISSQLCIPRYHNAGLKSAIVGLGTPWKWAQVTDECPPSQGPLVKHGSALCMDPDGPAQAWNQDCWAEVISADAQRTCRWDG